MEANQSSAVYYFWTEAESNTWGVTVAESEDDTFSMIKEFTLPELSAITAPENEGGNGEGASWGDAIVSNDGERIFVNGRNSDNVVVFDTNTHEVETILEVGDRPVHSFIYEDELWVHVDGDGGFNVIDKNTLEVSEFIAANTVGTGHGKLLVAPELDPNTYVTNTREPSVFPINLETREVSPPIEIAGGNPEIGTHDKGYDPATKQAFFQLTGSAGFTFIDTTTNTVVLDQYPILGRVAHTPNNELILILNAAAEENDIGIWDTTLETHTLPDFDSEVTIGGSVSVNGTHFYEENSVWEAWIPQTEGDKIAVLDLSTNEVDYIEVGNLTIPEGVRHFSRRGEIDEDYFFTYSDEGGKRIDLDTYEVSGGFEIPGQISRMAVVPLEQEIIGTDQADELVGTDANEMIDALAGDDLVAGGLGNDTILGGDGEDILRGDTDSRSPGGSDGGDDVISGGGGNDRIGGKAGNDLLSGGEGDDAIWGDAGDDTIMGVTGDDTLTGDDYSGGSGSDLFVFGNGDGTDTITDFDPTEDMIGLVEGELTFETLEITDSDAGAAISVMATGETLAILSGIDADELIPELFTMTPDVSLV